MTTTNRAKLLDGVRVLDMTNVLAGPFCGYQLAQLGAEVIKIEVPGVGDLARELGADSELNKRKMGVSFLAQNAGKKSVTLNLKTEEGRALFKRMVERADVVLENFRPGVMERLGLGYDALKATNPAVIYCAISGFGQHGPLRDNPAYDQIIQGMSGIMSVTGDKDSAPLRVGYPVCDTLGGITAAFAIAAALYRRAVAGTGEFIDVSMLDASLSAMGWAVSNYMIAGQDPVPMGNENISAAPSGLFKTGDGMLNIAANKQEQFVILCDLVGRPDLVGDCRFDNRDARKRNRYALRSELETGLATRSAQEWETILNQAGVPAGSVMSVPEVLKHPQIADRALIYSFDDVPGVDRRVSIVRAGFRLAGGDPGAASPPPALGADTEALLGELGLAPDEIVALRERRVI